MLPRRCSDGRDYCLRTVVGAFRKGVAETAVHLNQPSGCESFFQHPELHLSKVQHGATSINGAFFIFDIVAAQGG